MDFFKAIVSGVQLARRQHEEALQQVKDAQDQEEEQLQLALAMSRSSEADEIAEGRKRQEEEEDLLLALRLQEEAHVTDPYSTVPQEPVPSASEVGRGVNE